jgi:AcrR family transcriptional regulator
VNLPPPRKSFRETQFELREEAILDATNRLLGDKGYEAMSMDDIAATSTSSRRKRWPAR